MGGAQIAAPRTFQWPIRQKVRRHRRPRHRLLRINQPPPSQIASHFAIRAPSRGPSNASLLAHATGASTARRCPRLVQRQGDRLRRLSFSLEQFGRARHAPTTATAMLEVAGSATKTGPFAVAHSHALHVRFVNCKENGASGQSAALLAELVANREREVLALAMSLTPSPGSAT